MSGFERLGVMPEIIRAIEDMGWLLQTPVQDEAIPLILGGGDVMIAAETGSGKTGAFSLPVLQVVYETLKNHLEGKNGGQGLRETDTKRITKGLRVQLNAADRDEKIAIDSSGVRCQSRGMGPRDWFGVRANVGVLRGSYYFEITVKDEGLCRVGWSTGTSSLNVGTDATSFGYGGTGMKSSGGNYEKYGVVFSKNDTIGCVCDRVNHIIRFTKNGKSLGDAFHIPRSLKSHALFPAVVLKNAEVEFSFGVPHLKFLPKDCKPVAQITEEEGICSSLGSSSGGLTGPAYDGRSPLCLILEPTRELAEQVYRLS